MFSFSNASQIYKSILYRTINNIVKGEKISEAFKDHWAVPDVAYFMIVTGESTGELDNMMQKVSEYYQGLHRNVVNNLKAFIEPILISFLAIVVGGIIISVAIGPVSFGAVFHSKFTPFNVLAILYLKLSFVFKMPFLEIIQSLNLMATYEIITL